MHCPEVRQTSEDVQSESVDATQVSPSRVHWPAKAQTSAFLQSASWRATHAPFSCTHLPLVTQGPLKEQPMHVPWQSESVRRRAHTRRTEVTRAR